MSVGPFLVSWGIRFPLSFAIVLANLYAAGTSLVTAVSNTTALLGLSENPPTLDVPSVLALWIGFVFLTGTAFYIVPLFAFHFIFPARNLAKYYGCKWALVTGASSGIGAAISTRLAQQGINVVLVALEDALLEKHTLMLRERFPNQEFRAVGVDLTREGYLEKVRDATEDISINVVFNNAGYLLLGGFTKKPLGAHLGNLECNVISGLKITHLIMSRMVESGVTKGAFFFTSSSASLFPAPAQSMYSSGKSFISSFAASLAIEASLKGYDILSIQPGPMRTNFYTQNVSGSVPKLDAFKFFLAMSNTPEEVAEILFRAAGRCTWLDTGVFSFVMRIIMRLVDVNAFVSLMKNTIHLSGDMKKQDLL